VPRRHPTDKAVLKRYTRAMRLYRNQRWRRAAEALEPLLTCPGAMGSAARRCCVHAHRALAAEAAERRNYAQAADHLQAAMRALGADRSRRDGSTRVPPGGETTRHCLREMERTAEARGGSFPRPGKLAQVQWHAGQREEAYMTLTRALRRDGNDAGLLLQMGMFLAAEERLDEARPVLARAAEAGCDNPAAHRLLALVAAAQGDVVAAVRALQRAVDLSPDDLVLAGQLVLSADVPARSGARLTVRLPVDEDGTDDEHLDGLARYLAAHPELADALLAAPAEEDGDLLALLSKAVDQALAQYRRRADLHWVAARLAQRMGRTEAAVEHARRAVSLNPRYLQARVLLADLYAGAGRIEQAVQAYRLAIADGADWADVHYRAAELLARCDRKTEARGHLRRALHLNRSYTRAAEALASLAA